MDYREVAVEDVAGKPLLQTIERRLTVDLKCKQQTRHLKYSSQQLNVTGRESIISTDN